MRPGEPIQRIALTLLDERLDQLVHSSLARLEHSEPAYATSTMTPHEKRQGMRSTLELALWRLSGQPIPASVADAATEVGRDRAERGFPLPALLHSFQIDIRNLWEAITAEGAARGLTTDPTFLRSCIRVWEAIEANSADVVTAYRQTERAIARRQDDLNQHALERLVTSGDRDPHAVTDAASILGIPIDTTMFVLVAAGVPPSHADYLSTKERLRRSRWAAHFGWSGDELHCVIATGDHHSTDAVRLLEPLAQWRCGTATVDGLAGVPRGIRFARAALRSHAESGIRPIEHNWTGAVMSIDEELSTAVAAQVLRPLARLRAHERSAVLETLNASLEYGSIAEIAARTYRHRNTIRHRIHVAERATGLTLTRPRDLALLALAIDWLTSPPGQATWERWCRGS